MGFWFLIAWPRPTRKPKVTTDRACVHQLHVYVLFTPSGKPSCVDPFYPLDRPLEVGHKRLQENLQRVVGTISAGNMFSSCTTPKLRVCLVCNAQFRVLPGTGSLGGQLGDLLLIWWALLRSLAGPWQLPKDCQDSYAGLSYPTRTMTNL